MNTDVGALSRPKLYLHLHPMAKATLGDVVTGAVGESKRASWLIDFGAVYIDQHREADAARIIGPENLVRIHLLPKRYHLNREALRQRIVFESEDYLVVNKPSGLPMHPTLDNLHENLISGFDIPLHITHRLDVPTSGLVVVAKTKEYQSLFNKIVSDRSVKKVYQAATAAPVSLGAHTHFMQKSVKAPKKLVAEIPKGESSSDFEICQLVVQQCERQDDIFVSTIELLTGRTHQIRAQLSFLGSPILGDEMYGGFSFGRFGLHASHLSFVCPKYLKLQSFSSSLELPEREDVNILM